MLKNWTQIILQKILGFQNYLFVFAAFTIYRIRNTKYDQEFLHFLSMVPDNGVIIDIGANIGITTIPLSKHLPHTAQCAYIKKDYPLFWLAQCHCFPDGCW